MESISQRIHQALLQAIRDCASEHDNLTLDSTKIVVGPTEDFSLGDYATPVALALSKLWKVSPMVVADKLVEALNASDSPDSVSRFTRISIANPGYINFTLTSEYIHDNIKNIIDKGIPKPVPNGRVAMVEYTDPNPFKIFHIGHLMSNAIGESISRLIAWDGTRVIRANYQGDVGLHVAKTLWAILHDREHFPSEDTPLVERMGYIGKAYVQGSQAYEDDEQAKQEINVLNGKIFRRSNEEINRYYDLGKKWSLEYFDSIYAKLDTRFDHIFLESEVANQGLDIVAKHPEIFVQSEGATVFKGSHTRVFINSQGLPTYEAKELGLTARKFSLYPNIDQSIVITANEQNDYYRIILEALAIIQPDWCSRTRHFGHGFLRPTTGKMSSRKGNIIAAEDLIADLKSLVHDRLKDKEYSEKDREDIGNTVAIGAIKYSILRQAVGGDVVYDREKSISFEGDSGPYIQYSCVRAQSILDKARDIGLAPIMNTQSIPQDIERYIIRYNDVVMRAKQEFSPHRIVEYITKLASLFNQFYASQDILGGGEYASNRLAIVKSFLMVMESALGLLAIKIPDKM